MYNKPTLERFGTFRDLTRIGTGANGDGGISFGRFVVLDGCAIGCASAS